MKENVPNELKQFFGAYFHEDWPHDAATSDEVIAGFISEGRSPEELSRLADMIDAYVIAAPTDEALEEGLFAELGCYYVPSADGLRVDAWLRHVANRLRSSGGS
jgi:hypothetical protein